MKLYSLFFLLAKVTFALPTFQRLLSILSLQAFGPLIELDDYLHNVNPPPPQRIAIIGSGIVGASAAFDTYERSLRNSAVSPPEITIYERNDVVGGRITRTRVYDQPELTIDTCAATFNPTLDTCIGGLATRVGLSTRVLQPLEAGTGIWDGERMVGLIDDDGFRDQPSWSFFKQARYYARYGDEYMNFETNRTQAETRYITLCNGGKPFKSLIHEINQTGAAQLVARQLTSAFPIPGDFPEAVEPTLYIQEVVEAALRERFFGSIFELNELSSVLGLSSASSLSSIEGGNVRLIDRLIKLSSAKVLLNTEVKNITSTGTGQWVVDAEDSDRNGSTTTFDKVILAAPLSIANIEITAPGENFAIPLAPYIDSVVTHFTTTSRLNATFFNVTYPGPQTILTAVGACVVDAGPNCINSTQPPFFSLRLLDSAVTPVGSASDRPTDFLYKIVSEHNITDAQIVSYLEQSVNLTAPQISWIHREYLPRSIPRFDMGQYWPNDIEVIPGFYYVGTGEVVVGNIEFGCRMGTNVARLIVPERRQVTPPGNGVTLVKAYRAENLEEESPPADWPEGYEERGSRLVTIRSGIHSDPYVNYFDSSHD